MSDYTIERIYIPSVEQMNCINSVESKECTQDDVAGCYHDCLIADFMATRRGDTGVDFKAVNEAILKRWPKGLSRIKKKAWKQGK